MKPLKLVATKDSPDVHFNPETNIFEIQGVCYPENIQKFFSPIFEWIDEYFLEVKGSESINIKLNLKYQYLNSSSLKYLVELMRKLKLFTENGILIEIIWHYEENDYDMKDLGKELFEMSIIKFPYKLVSYTED